MLNRPEETGQSAKHALREKVATNKISQWVCDAEHFGRGRRGVAGLGHMRSPYPSNTLNLALPLT